MLFRSKAFLLAKCVCFAYYDNALDFIGGMILKVNRVFVLGGDLRSVYIADYFRKKGKKKRTIHEFSFCFMRTQIYYTK